MSHTGVKAPLNFPSKLCRDLIRNRAVFPASKQNYETRLETIRADAFIARRHDLHGASRRVRICRDLNLTNVQTDDRPYCARVSGAWYQALHRSADWPDRTKPIQKSPALSGLFRCPPRQVLGFCTSRHGHFS